MGAFISGFLFLGVFLALIIVAGKQFLKYRDARLLASTEFSLEELGTAKKWDGVSLRSERSVISLASIIGTIIFAIIIFLYTFWVTEVMPDPDQLPQQNAISAAPITMEEPPEMIIEPEPEVDINNVEETEEETEEIVIPDTLAPPPPPPPPPAPREEVKKIYTLVDVKAEFPGGKPAEVAELYARFKKIMGDTPLVPGRSMVDCVVHEDGTVSDFKIVKSVSPEIDKAIVQAIASMNYKPAEKNGKPVASHHVVRFNLHN